MSEPPTAWSIYLIRARDNSLYTGITTDVSRRFAEHQGLNSKGESLDSPSLYRGAKALRGKGPLALVYQKLVGNRSEATQLEYRVKQLPKSEKEALIVGSLSIDSLYD